MRYVFSQTFTYMSMSMFLSYLEICVCVEMGLPHTLFCSPFFKFKWNQSLSMCFIRFIFFNGCIVLYGLNVPSLFNHITVDEQIVSNFCYCKTSVMHILVHLSLHTCEFLLERFLRTEMDGWKACTFKIWQIH